MNKQKTIKPIGDFLVVRGEIEKSAIVLADDKKNMHRLKSFTVFKVGEKVETLKEGDEITVSSNMISDTSRIITAIKDENNKEVKGENEFYMVLKEEDVIGKYE